MNAIKFIQQYGVEKAREVVEGAPRICSYWQEYGVDNNQCYGYDDFYGDWYKYWDITNAPMWQKIFTKEEFSFNRVKVKDLKRLVESVDIISKFDSVQEAKDAISNSPDGATDYRKLSCTIRYIKQSERFFEYWDGSIWCRPTVPFTEETHILRFTELSRLKQAIADYEAILS